MGNTIFTGYWWVSWSTGQLSTVQSIQSVARQLGHHGDMKHLSLIQMVITKGVCVCVCVHVCRVCMYVCICVCRVCLCVRVHLSRNNTIFNDAFQMCYLQVYMYVYKIY